MHFKTKSVDILIPLNTLQECTQEDMLHSNIPYLITEVTRKPTPIENAMMQLMRIICSSLISCSPHRMYPPKPKRQYISLYLCNYDVSTLTKRNVPRK